MASRVGSTPRVSQTRPPWVETHLSDLLPHTSEFGRQREHHVGVHAGWWQRPILDQWRFIVVQQVHVVVRGRGCRDVGLLLHPPLLLHREHRSNSVEVFISFLLGRVLLQLLRSHLLDPPLLAVLSTRGHHRGAGAVLSVVVLDVCLCPETTETGWSSFVNQTVRFGGHCELVPASIPAFVFVPETLSRSAPTSYGPLSVSSFASSLTEVSLLSLSSPECYPADQQKTHWVPPAPAGDQMLLLLPGK
jgi:hypothetical protein